MAQRSESGVLAGVRVVDLGQYIAGPAVAMLLGDFGADVVRVDPPGGPRWNSDANAALQRNKRSIELDLKSEEGRDAALRLIATADVLIEGFRPGVMARLGLDPAELRERQPALITCSLPGFGSDDPRAAVPGWEGLVSTAAGIYPPKLWDVTGPPRFSALPMASIFAAAIAAHSVLAALLARESDGYGDQIEVPLFDACFDAIGSFGESPSTLEQGGLGQFASEVVRNPAFLKYVPIRCGDGRYLGQGGAPPRGMHDFWDAFLPRELKMDDSAEAGERGRRAVGELFATRPAQEWERLMQEEYGAASATTQTTREWLDDDHALASESVLAVDDPILGPTHQAGFAVRLSADPPRIRCPRRPPGSDTAAVLRELAAPDRSRRETSAPPAPPATGRRLPLDGVRVLDCTHLLAGPIGARILAEYGAEVIKINKAAFGLGHPDLRADDATTFVAHRTTGAGKRSIYLDLKSSTGRAILDDLVGTSDIVHVNAPMHVAARLGLDEARLRTIRQDLIYSRLTLHASGGWRSEYRGHEDLAQQVTGVTLRWGGGVPEIHAILINDHLTGHLDAFGILLALYARSRQGHGQRVEAALAQGATFMQLPYMVSHATAVWDEPTGHARGWSASDRLYDTADGTIWVAAPGPDGATELAAALGCERAELSSWAERELRKRPTSDWLGVLGAAGISAHPWVAINEVMDSDIATARGLSVTRDHPGLGLGREVGAIRRFRTLRHGLVAPAVKPGWHTREVLEELGRGDQVDVLVDEGIVATDESLGVRA